MSLGDFDTFRAIQIRPRSAYIHIPFCRHRCGYCNFSLVANRDYLIDRFLDALEVEIGWVVGQFELETLFFGGGTPSHLSPNQMDRLRDIVGSRFSLHREAEVTAECNPNDLSDEKVAALDRFGVNRFSLGVQSLQRDKLRILERDHTANEVREAVARCKSIGRSVSLDLIFAAPNESFKAWKVDLELALQLEPHHVSTYELTFEKGTQFWNRLSQGALEEADEDTRLLMYEEAIDQLNQFGLKQYEISSFAKSGHECRHNMVYWSGDPYFAFGPGASRFIDGARETNHQSPTHYLKQVEAGNSPVAQRERLAPEPAARERLAIGLRMIEGLDIDAFESRTGFSPVELLGSLKGELEDASLLIVDQRARLTAKGINVADWIAAKILDG